MSGCNSSRNSSRKSVIVRADAGGGKQQQRMNKVHNQTPLPIVSPQPKYPNHKLIRSDQMDSGYNSAIDISLDHHQLLTKQNYTPPVNEKSVESKQREEQDEIEVASIRSHMGNIGRDKSVYRYKPYGDHQPSSTSTSNQSNRLNHYQNRSCPCCESTNDANYSQPFISHTNSFFTETDSDGNTPLHLAVAREDQAGVNYITHSMLTQRYSLDIGNKRQQTSLHMAVITGHVGIIKLLLSLGACPRLPDRQGNTAVHVAVQCSSLESLEAILENSSAFKTLSKRNYNGFTPLHLAIFRKDLKIISHLISKGSDCNSVDGTSGRTPLFHAVSNGLDDVVTFLVTVGASVNLPNYAGVTPLVVATDKRLKNISRLLISKGATMSAKDEL